jgi:hypothetical protein
MVFLFLISGSVCLSAYAAINLPYHPLLSALLAFVICFVTVSLSAVIAVFLSLLLGRNDKFVLRKKTRYSVWGRTDDHVLIILRGGKVAVIPISKITETRTDTEELYPYIEIEHYNIGGWRRFLLLSVYEDELKYILHLPCEDGP